MQTMRARVRDNDGGGMDNKMVSKLNSHAERSCARGGRAAQEMNPALGDGRAELGDRHRDDG